MNDSVTRKCGFCGEVKSLLEFSKDPRTKTGYSALCLVCNKNKSKVWRDKNPDKSRESVKRYREKYPEKHREMYDSWSSRNKEKVRESARENYNRHQEAYRESARIQHAKRKLEHPQEVRDYQSEWRKKNPEKVSDAQKKWSHSHPERVKIKTQNRNEKKKNSTGSVTEREWVDILERCGYTCLWCRRNDVKITMDHVVPLSKGGLHEIENIQPLCRSCNSKKGVRIMDFR